MLKISDPEKEFEVEVTLLVRGYGKAIHVTKLIERVVHLLRVGKMNFTIKSTF